MKRSKPDKRDRILSDWGLRIGVFVLFVLAWQLSAVWMKNMLIPTFTETINGFIQLVFVTGRIWQPLYISNQALVLGYILSIAVAIPLGLAAGRVRWIDRVLNPYIGIFLAIPVAPLIPIAITALGLGLASRVAIVFLFTFVFIAVNTRAGVRNVDPGLIEMAKSFGANERQIWHRIVIPGAVPRFSPVLESASDAPSQVWSSSSYSSWPAGWGVCCWNSRGGCKRTLYLPQFWS